MSRTRAPVPQLLVRHRHLKGETEPLDEILVLIPIVDVHVDDPQLGSASSDDEANREGQPGRSVRVLRVVPAGEFDCQMTEAG